jgi:hypothetical protein
MRPGSILRRAAVPLLLLLTGFLFPARGMGFSADDLALDYLIQDVCVDPSGRVQLIDPYYCPAGDTLRPLGPGEALPYHRYDQPSANMNARQRHDSYPARTRDGRIIVINPFDHAPFDQFKPWRDGYDVTMVRDGWASAGGTRSRLLGTTFFGAGCKPYNGWVFFPVSALDGRLIRAGEAEMPIRGVHWERNGEPWPGPCPARYATDSWTSWEPLPAFRFGGIGGTPLKTIDAIRSIHGFRENPRFLAIGHVEVFYFTRLYGLTRWESWAPKERLDREPDLQQRFATANVRCTGPAEYVYKGVNFARIACRDWTSVQVLPAPERAPFWPVPNAF